MRLVAAVLALALGMARAELNASLARPMLMRSGRQLNSIGRWHPDYPNYEFMNRQRDLDNGISYLGAAERIRRVMNKIKQGQKIKVVTIGGSITSGQGCPDAPYWGKYLFGLMEATYGAEHLETVNGAVGGTISAYMSVCHNMHVPADADLVFVEYSINDSSKIEPTFQNNVRRGFERLLRKLLNYDHKPAVVLMHAYVWHFEHPSKGSFWSNAEREHGEFALYYHLPMLSVKAAVFERMLAGDEGFQVLEVRSSDEDNLAGKAFYWDHIHPDGRTGARTMGELAFNLVRTVYNSLEHKPYNADEEDAFALAPLPAPMVPGNYESISDKCFIGMHFVDTVKEKEGFDWINESKTDRPKWGFVANTTGSFLRIHIDTVSASKTESVGDDDKVIVELAYLRSYENMGIGKVTCEGGCNCEESKMQGHHDERNSQLHLHNFLVSQSHDCIIRVTVSDETTSNSHKVKVAGVTISEETGMSGGIKSEMTIEYVHDISARSKDGTFTIENHA